MALSPYDDKIYLTNHGAKGEVGLEKLNSRELWMENFRMG